MSAQSLESNNLKNSIGENDEDVGDDEWDEEEESDFGRSSSRRGGSRTSKPRKAARGIVKRVVRLQGTLLHVSFKLEDVFVYLICL